MSVVAPLGSAGGLQSQSLTPYVVRRWNYHLNQQGERSCTGVQFGHAAVMALACVAAGVFKGRRQRRHCGRCHQVRRCAPTDYYGLLGLPRFQGTQAELKAAYRRLVKLVHPDILGEESVALQALVTEAYNTLSDENRRAAYDRGLGSQRCRSARATRFGESSVWAPMAPPDADAIFVDESQCVRCNNCIDIAPNTFKYHTIDGDERARVSVQYGDDATEIGWAVTSCPTGAISYVPRQDIAFMEIAMAECQDYRRQGRRSRHGGKPFTGVESAFHKVKAKFIEREAKLDRQIPPDALIRQANAMKAAIDLIPESVSLRAWPAAATDDQDATFQEEQQQLEEA
mmetsp:Transcript_115683/g.230604  ORF Transcript_115683/g.230604 Transcript_115683/m.230604 type:complete len:343 (+) Transcript_115683:126-1154(+)